MKKILLFSFIVANGLRTLNGAEAVHFLNPDLQLGHVRPDQTVPLTFVLTNGSEQTVKIVSADPSCRCVTVSNSPTEIVPHSVGNFELFFSSARSTGMVVRTLFVELGDGQVVSGQFTANVVAGTNYNLRSTGSPVKGGLTQNLKPATNSAKSAIQGK